jgi:tryptophanyl-tRNA synthetase
MSKRKRILSGNRPTGLLHLGNYVGALKNWVELQDQYECFFMIADWHALTSDYADPAQLETNTAEMILDWLSVGLDPQRSTLFIQSKVKQHAELSLLLSFITPLPWLERCPTYKDQISQGSGVMKLRSKLSSACCFTLDWMNSVLRWGSSPTESQSRIISAVFTSSCAGSA